MTQVRTVALVREMKAKYSTHPAMQEGTAGAYARAFHLQSTVQYSELYVKKRIAMNLVQ